MQSLLGIVVPIIGGLVGGVLLVISEPVYLIYSVLAIGAGYFGGLEHVGAEEGALRGFTGGVLFGTFILFAKEISGSDPKAELPHPEVLLVVLTTVLGIGAGGARAAARAAAARPGWLPSRLSCLSLLPASSPARVITMRSVSIATATGRWPAQCSAYTGSSWTAGSSHRP